MKVAIVILNYNGAHFLKQFLPSVLQYSAVDAAKVGFSTDIIVADNASTDNSLSFLKEFYPNIQIIALERNFGFAEGYNQALMRVDADIFVLLNSDVEVSENWLSPCINTLCDDKLVGACQPKIKAFHNKTTFEHAGAAGGMMDALGYPFCRGRLFESVETDLGQYNDKVEIFWATGAALFIRADLFSKIGGFDSDFFAHMEEIDLCWRLRKAGYKIMVCPQSTVFHVGGGTLKQSNPFKTYLNFRNNLVTLLKNESGWRLYFIIPLRLVLDGLAGLLFLSKGNTKDVFAIIKAHFYIYSHFIYILKKRMKAQQLVDDLYIGTSRTVGLWRGSIVWQYYIKSKRYFSDL
jgi:GT2 family glycosyltransferase